VPVLVSAGPPTEKRRVLVAVDLSPAARPTIAAARQFTELFRGELRALHVVEPVPVISELPPPVDERELTALAREHLEREIWPLLPDATGGRVVRHGRPADAIAQEAAGWHADLVVVGSHGRGWLDRLVIGSVTEQLLGRLPTSLLVVPSAAAAEGAPASGLVAVARATTHSLVA
jgi:nucleotide-binding universal stress UspA family protein